MMVGGEIEFSWHLSSVPFYLHENNVSCRHYRTLMRTGASPDGQDPGWVMMRHIYQGDFKRCRSPCLAHSLRGWAFHPRREEIKNDDLREFKAHLLLCQLAPNDNVLLLSLKSFMSYSG